MLTAIFNFFKSIGKFFLNAFLNILQMIYLPVLNLSDKWINIDDLMPTLNVLTNLSSCLNVFLPMPFIAQLLTWTIIFYAIRIIVAFIKLAFNHGILTFLLNKVVGFFGGFFKK